MAAAPHSVSPYRPDVDGLRAIAILAVLAYHASNLLLPGGFVGVDIFFVISGYLITGILLRDLALGQFSIGTFYRRRVRRIFPALIVVLAACWILGWFGLLPDEFKQLGKHIAAASVFISNFVLFKESGYFDSAADLKPLLHLWSLGVEEQFYILWPILLWAAWKWQRHVLALLVVMFVGSLAVNIIATPRAPEFGFYLPLTRFWELMAGGLLAYAERFAPQRLNFSALHRNLMSVGGLLLIVVACVLFTKLDNFPGWRALLPVAGAVMLIAAGSAAWLNRTFLSHRAMVGIGLISYPLYLWHWPLLSYARIVESGEPVFWIRIIAVALAFLLAWATYHYIETPVRKGAFGQRKRAILWLVLAMVALGLLGLLTEQRQGMPKFRNVNIEMYKDLERLDVFRSTLTKCDEAYGTSDLSWCYQSQPGTPEIALFGDSHADAIFPGITAVDEQHTWLLIGHSSCPPLKDVRAHTIGRADECFDKNNRAIEALARTASIKTVVLANLGGYYLGDTISPQHTGQNAPNTWTMQSALHADKEAGKAEIFYDGMARTVKALERAGKRVVIFLDTPEFDFWPVACLERPFTLTAAAAKEPCAVDRAKVVAAQAEYLRLMQKLKKKYPSITLYDPSGILCDEQLCYAGKPGTLYFRDTHHLSIRGSRLVAQKFIPWLEERSANTAPAP